jgi:hypothetical protein
MAINMSDKLFVSIKEKIEAGLYQSFDGFLEIAAFNQLALERGVTPAELMARGHRSIPPDDTAVQPNGRFASSGQLRSVAGSRRKAATVAAQSVVTIAPPRVAAPLLDADVEAAFASVARVREALALPEPARAVTHDRADPVFGQVNRLFPLKLACRWLASAAARDARWPDIVMAGGELAAMAAVIGSALARWDSETERKRDEQLATGLPRHGNKPSQDRFLTQFVARVTKSGEVYPGAVCQYELARCRDAELALTDRGREFSDLGNTVLDARDPATPAALSKAETDFLVSQVVAYVPGERDDMRAILSAVQAGSTTPSELTKSVTPFFQRGWTDSMVQTHISGLIARLGDLRLLRRNWQGRNVRYELGDADQIAAILDS